MKKILLAVLLFLVPFSAIAARIDITDITGPSTTKYATRDAVNGKFDNVNTMMTELYAGGANGFPTCTNDEDVIAWDTGTSTWVCLSLPTLTFSTGLTNTDGTITVTANTYQAYDADLTAWAGISPTTGSINTSGTFQSKVLFNSYSTAQTLTASAHNSTIVQMTVAAEVTMWDCETANVGDTVMLWARDGTALTADYELDIAATAGTKVTLMCTADDTWSVFSETAASVTGGAAD